jgi:hypothetical protein
LPISTAWSEEPRAVWACAASSAAAAGLYCLRLTPRITFQPPALARVARPVRSAGVMVAMDQDGALWPVEVQNVSSTVLPPIRITDDPRVLR